MYPATQTNPPILTNDDETCPDGMTPSERDHQVFKSVFDALAARIIKSVPPVMQAFEALGAGTSCSTDVVVKRLKTIIRGILVRPMPPADPCAPSTKTMLLESLFVGMMVEKARAKSMAKTIETQFATYAAAHRRKYQLDINESRPLVSQGCPSKLSVHMPFIPGDDDSAFWTGLTIYDHELRRVCEIYNGLAEILASARGGYVPTTMSCEPAPEQLVTMMKFFPYFADACYAQAGLQAVKGVPPKLSGDLTLLQDTSINSKEARFVSAFAKVAAFKKDRFKRRDEVVGAIALVGSLFTRDPKLVELLAGLAYDIAKNSLLIFSAEEAKRLADGSFAIGGIDRKSTVFYDNEVDAAYWALLIDTASNLLAEVCRLSPHPMSEALQKAMVKAVGNGLKTAVNRNTWEKPNREFLIVEAFAQELGKQLVVEAFNHGVTVKIQEIVPLRVSLPGGTGLQSGTLIGVIAEDATKPAHLRIIRVDAHNGTMVVEGRGSPGKPAVSFTLRFKQTSGEIPKYSLPE